MLPHRFLRSAAAFIALFALLLAGFVIWASEQSRLAEKRAELSDQVSDHAHAIESGIEHSLSSAYALAALIHQGKGQVGRFPAIAGEMLSYYEGTAALALAPDGVVREIFPLRGNEKAVGHNLLRDPHRDKEAIMARDTGRLTLAGPFQLVQGGLGAAGRLPVYLDDGSGKKFWGFAAVLLRFPQTIAPGNLEQLRQRGYEYQLWRVHPDTGERQIIAASSEHTLPCQPIEHQIRVPNGHWTLSVAPRSGWISWPQLTGKILLGLLFCLGLTALVLALLKLRHYGAELEQRVSTRTRELAAARDAAEAASRAKSTFLTNMSHELRTPLNAIMGMTELALRQTRDIHQRSLLEKSSQASRHLLQIINDLLNLSRIEAERIELENIPFFPAEVIRSSMALCETTAQAKGLELRFAASADWQERAFLGDPTRLQQILDNLIANAIKFSAEGCIDLRIAEIESKDGLTGLRFEVADRGIGIAPENQERIFLPFEQADNSMTRKYGGSGLGLSICKRLVQLMGGEIACDSVPGQGSVFWFTLYLESAAAPPEKNPDTPLRTEAELRQRFAGLRVLLAEDETLSQEVGRGLLEAVGMQVDVAEDGVQAVNLAMDNAYGLIILDLQMPNLNGLETATIIRSLNQYAATPIVALTANAFELDRERASAAGMNDFLAKPIHPETLYAALLRILTESAKAAGAG